MARPTNAAVHERRARVRDALLAGIPIDELQQTLQMNGKPVFGPGVLDKDVAHVRGVWAHHDTDWFTRAANARRMAEERYTAQLARLHGALEAMTAPPDPADPNPPEPATVGDIATIERLIAFVIGRLHDLGREIDPGDYMSKLRESYILTPAERDAAPPKAIAHE